MPVVSQAKIDFTKAPTDVLDYFFDWSSWLTNADTIISSNWLPSPGITVNSNAFTDTSTIVWLSGGSDGLPYTVTNRVVTAQGRTKDKAMTIRVANAG